MSKESHASEGRIKDIEKKIHTLDTNNPSQFRAKQLLEKELSHLKSKAGKRKFSKSTPSLEDSPTKTCKDIDLDESIKIRTQGKRKKKQGCLEYIQDQTQRLQEIKKKMEMQEEARKRMRELMNRMIETRAMMVETIEKSRAEYKKEFVKIQKQLVKHDADLTERKHLHENYLKERHAPPAWLLNCLTNLLWYALFAYATIRDGAMPKLTPFKTEEVKEESKQK